MKHCEGTGFLISDFRVGAELASTPLVFFLFDLVVTGNDFIEPSLCTARSTLLKCLSILAIRQKMLDYKAITPLTKVLSNEVSLTCSKSLMSALNLSGLTYSYSKDLKDSKISRDLWNTVGIKTSVQKTPSNMHWIECDNLETMLKSPSIHNAERLTHFLTSQLEYVKGKYAVMDLFQKPQPHDIDISSFHLTLKEEGAYLKFLELCFKKVVDIQSSLLCDDIVSGLAKSANDNNNFLTPFQADTSPVPSERIIETKSVFNKTETIYLRMEKLCSSNINDIRKLLELTANDYGLNELCFIPSAATSPLLFASSFINKTSHFEEVKKLSPIYFIPWGFVSHPVTKEACVIPDNSISLKNIIRILINKVKDNKDGIFVATELIKSILEYSDSHPSAYSQVDQIIISITYAELLRKQGYVNNAQKILLHAYSQITNLAAIKSSVFEKFSSTSLRQICNALLINAANCCIQTGLLDQSKNTLDAVVFKEGNIVDQYHRIATHSLASSTLACQGNFSEALERAQLCCDYSDKVLPENHSILGKVFNQLAVLKAANNEFEVAMVYFDKALKIVDETTGCKSVSYMLINFNKYLAQCVSVKNIEISEFDKFWNNESFPKDHFLRNTMKFDMLQTEMEQSAEPLFIWMFSFISLLDHPFSWIDNPPVSKCITFGADYQVWAHLDQLLHLNPLRYSWISTLFLGSFHKLANLHEKLVKRYGKFHIEKHAAAFLDNPSACKIQYLLSMKDFDSSNQFYYHDILAGITELLGAIQKYERKVTNLEEAGKHDLNLEQVKEFCEHFAKYEPELKVIINYLFYEGLSVLGFLEAQKNGDFDLDMLFIKIVIPLQFTTRGFNYGPALCYHVRDMFLLRPFEESNVRTLWVSNKSSEPGHCRPHDQNLEALFNNSAKNCFKLGTVQNVLSKASMIQERELCHNNLKTELRIAEYKAKPSTHRLKITSFIRLRACWQKGLEKVFNSLLKHKADDFIPKEMHGLHSINESINFDLTNVREIREKRVDKFVSVKVGQVDGWKLENPKFPEILTVQRSPTKRQQKAALNHAKQQVEVMSELLLQSTGMQVSMSDTSKPIQLLKKDGASLHFAKKSDLTLWLFKSSELSFLNSQSFESATDNLKNVTCMIRDCMFDFRSLKIPTCSYKEMCFRMIEETVIPFAHKYANKSTHFTFIQTFDRRADQTKGCTEATRTSMLTSPLEYSGVQVDQNELIKSYATRWLDRDNGRQKIITAYVRACQDRTFLQSQNLPNNFTCSYWWQLWYFCFLFS